MLSQLFDPGLFFLAPNQMFEWEFYSLLFQQPIMSFEQTLCPTPGSKLSNRVLITSMHCGVKIRHAKAVKAGVSHQDKKVVGGPGRPVSDQEPLGPGSWTGRPFTVNHDAAWPEDSIELS